MQGKKKTQGISDLFNAETKPNFFVYRIQSKNYFLRKKSFLRKREGLKEKREEAFLTALAILIKIGSHNVNKKAL